MLTRPLPNPDIAADMLLAAEITEPVKMAMPPNPARCQSLVRGSAVKAATLALSTDDPNVLERLAKHAALVVKRSAASNPNLPDAGRRAIESFAIKRGDNSLLNAVIEHASLEYITESMADSERRGWTGWIFANSKRLSQIFESETPPTNATLKTLLLAHPETTAAVVGRSLGLHWPGPWDPIQYAEELRPISKDLEVKFLLNFVSHAKLADTAVVTAYQRMRESAPANFPDPASLDHRATMGAVAVEAGADVALLELGMPFSAPVFSASPTIEVLEHIERLYGLVGVKATLTKAISSAGPEVLRWALERLVVPAPDGSYRSELFSGFAENLIPHCSPNDHARLRALLSACPTYTVVRYVAGQLGAVDLDFAEELANTQFVDVLKSVKTLRDVPWGQDLLHRLIDRGNLQRLLGMSPHVYMGLTLEEVERIVERVISEEHDVSEGAQLHRLATEEFVNAYDRPDLTTAQVLTWLRLAQSAELTVRFFCGELKRTPEISEIEALFATKKRSFGSYSPSDLLARNFAEIRPKVPDAQLDAAVDAAGSEFFARAYNGRNANAFIAYLVDRLDRSTASSDEWTTAFELLATTSVSVGKAISGAGRLNRIRNGR